MNRFLSGGAANRLPSEVCKMELCHTLEKEEGKGDG